MYHTVHKRGVNGCERRDGNGELDEYSLISNMSRFIGIGCALGHDMNGVKEALSGIIKGICEKMVDR